MDTTTSWGPPPGPPAAAPRSWLGFQCARTHRMAPRPIDTVGGWGFPRHVENLGKVACEDRIGLPHAMLDLVPPEQRVALVTGASRGIGRAVARTFARSGMRVALNARGEKDLQRACRELAPHAEVMAVPGDLSDPTTAASILDAVRERFGPVQILINNAGTADLRPLPRIRRHGHHPAGSRRHRISRTSDPGAGAGSPGQHEQHRPPAHSRRGRRRGDAPGTQQPPGCVYDLDRDPPAFVE